MTGTAVLILFGGVLLSDWPRYGLAIRRALRTAKGLARDSRVPRSIKALFVVALLPVPGPFDELVALLAVVLLMRVAPGLLREHWERAA